MTRQTRFIPSMLLAGLLAISANAKPLRADAPATAPAAALAVAKPSPVRPFNAVMADLQAALPRAMAVTAPDTVLTDPAKRAAAAPTAIPILKHLVVLGNELATTGHQGSEIASQIVNEFEKMLLVFDDPDTLSQTKSRAEDRDPKVSATAKQNLMFADWVHKSNATDQAKLLDSAQSMMKDSPADLQLWHTLDMMSQIGPATPDLRMRAKAMAAAMQTPLNLELKAQAEAEKKMHSFEGKPLVITGSTVDGKAFTTADWKGKVILVDFWATWCGPCRAELPRVKKAYEDFHARGLEVLGVSNDYDARQLNDFVTADPRMPWPQLLDPKAAAARQFSSITTGFSIREIPVMFLIDKQGVLTSVDAREDFEKQIAKLLEQ